jgi:hypothetical protein
MALQDLTPQLRTRLSRMERAVGWFLILAVLLLAFGFGYYIYATAERKGWFKTKAPYFTLVSRATGLKVGDPVQMMGFDVGQITHIDPMAPDSPYDVFIAFEIKSPNIEYLWTEGSKARVTPADLLGKRVLEVTKGEAGYPSFIFFPLKEVSLEDARGLSGNGNWELAQDIFYGGTNRIARARDPLTNLTAIAAAGHKTIEVMDAEPSHRKKAITGMWDAARLRYEPYTNGVSKYWLEAEESPAVTEQLQSLISAVQAALPSVLELTNQLTLVLSNSGSLASNLNLVAISAQPAVSNLAVATAQLNRPGALGEWLIPTNLNHQLDSTLGNASATLATANTNIATLAAGLEQSLQNLADLTGNLSHQVEGNSNLVSSISQAIVHADELVQGLKHHWLLRSAFKTKTPKSAPVTPPKKLRSPKERSR